MGNQGPGYLANLLFLGLITGICLIAINTIVSQIGNPVGYLPAFVIAAVILFAGFLLYYKMFLAERSIL